MTVSEAPAAEVLGGDIGEVSGASGEAGNPAGCNQGLSGGPAGCSDINITWEDSELQLKLVRWEKHLTDRQSL